MKTVTIKDVARQAGVSVATVSRLVNNSGVVGEKTAKKVRLAIKELSFRPNVIGRSLKTSRTKLIGVVIPSLSNPVFADAVAGINDELSDIGYTLMFTSTDYHIERERQSLETLLSNRVEGLILTVANSEHSNVLDMLDKSRVPYVMLFNQPSPRNRPSVTVDNVSASKEVADIMVDHGHHCIAMISGSFEKSDRAVARKKGFVEGLKARGCPPPYICEVDFVDLDIDEVLQPLYAESQSSPTALFCSNDLLAISVIGALSRHGLRVPEDVSVFGFDGIAVGNHLYPTLTTVMQPAREMGRVAAQQLLGHISRGEEPETVILPYTMRLGESTGQASKHAPVTPQNLFQSKQKMESTI